MKRLSLLLSILLAIRAMHSAAGADLGGDEIVQRLRQTAAREVPYDFGTIAQVTIVPDKQSARLACSDNPEGVREVLIGADSKFLRIYCVLSSGTVTGGGSTVGKSVGAFRQVGSSAAIASWQVKDDRIHVTFQLTNDDSTIIRAYQDLEKAGPFSKQIPDWGALVGNTEILYPRLTAEQRVEVFTRLWSTVKFSFANFDLVPEVRWDEVPGEYLPQVMRDQPNDEFVRLLQRCIAQLKDGHTDIASVWGTGAPTACPALLIRRVEGKAVIAQVAATEEIMASGISVGDEILRVDDRPVQEVLEKDIYPYVFASTPQRRDLQAYPALLRGRAESKVSISIRTGEGKPRKTSLTRRANGTQLLSQGKIPDPVEYRDCGNGLVHVALNGFGSDRVVRMFKERFSQIRQAKGLLIDVRTNGGGNSEYGDAIISLLISKPIPSTRWKTPQYRAAFRAWGRDEDWYDGGYETIKPGTATPFPGPVVVLIGPGTNSAAEDFVVPLHAAGRALIVGQRSSGSTGQPLAFRFLGGKILGRVCAKRDQYPDGREFVGIGILPDRQVEPTIRDVIDGRDTVLEAGLKILQELVDQQEQPEESRR